MDTPFEEQFDQVLALIPVSKGAEPLEQILTNMDVDFAAEAGNKRQLQRKLINYLNSSKFDQVAGKEQLIKRAQEILQEHLGFAAVAAEDVNNVNNADLHQRRHVKTESQKDESSSMMTLRDKVLELSAQMKSHRRRYSPKLVQAEMQKSIYAGLRE